MSKESTPNHSPIWRSAFQDYLEIEDTAKSSIDAEKKLFLFLMLIHGQTITEERTEGIDRKEFAQLEKHKLFLPSEPTVKRIIQIGTLIDAIDRKVHPPVNPPHRTFGFDGDPNYVFDDAYQLALYMLRSSFEDVLKLQLTTLNPMLLRHYTLLLHSEIYTLYFSNTDARDVEPVIYRGQANENWETIPSIFRPKYPQKELPEDELQKRYHRVLSLVKSLQKEYPQFSEEQCLAIAQHYSSEAKTPTWLVDFTYSPFTALNFATQGATKNNKVGTVEMLYLPRWKIAGRMMTAGLGTIKEIEVPGVPRIKNQEALFLKNVHPEILDQYKPFSRKFHQHEGFEFEVPSEGISKQHLLYPAGDTFMEFMRQWQYQDTIDVEVESLELPPNPNKPLAPEDYAEIIKHWIRDNSMRKKRAFFPNKEIKKMDDIIQKLAHMHHDIYQLKKASFPIKSTLMQLVSTAERVIGKARDVGLEKTPSNEIYSSVLRDKCMPHYESTWTGYGNGAKDKKREKEFYQDNLELSQKIDDIIRFYFP